MSASKAHIRAGPGYVRRTSPGGFATLAAIRRASSRVSIVAFGRGKGPPSC
jgi:hypothetical protein